MELDRYTVAMDAELSAAVRVAAAKADSSVSDWLLQAAADKVRNELLGIALDEWEAEFGAFTEEELDAAAERMGIPRRSRGHAA